MNQQRNIWPKKISVDKRIVEILSGATYESFPKALKELITNSYDADAENVRILIDITKEIITISDDGSGMDEADLDFYFRIAGKSRSKSDTTSSGRKRIGKFGVGFLSIFPFFYEYQIESKKKWSTEIIFASVDCSKYFSNDSKLKSVDEIPITGGIKVSGKEINNQFTNITLRGFSSITKAFFSSSLKNLDKRKTIRRRNAIDQIIWDLSEDLPLKYKEDSYNTIINSSSPLPFRVIINNKTLSRNSYAKNILDSHKGKFEEVGNIKFQYFIATDFRVINPVEGRYLKLRNLNVGVGIRYTFGLNTEGKVYSRLAHLTGDINIISGLNDSIKVSREGFNYNEDFESLEAFFRKKLRIWAQKLEDKANLEKAERNFENDLQIDNIKNISKETEFISKEKDLKTHRSSTSNFEFITSYDEFPILPAPQSTDRIYKTLVIGNRSYSLRTAKWDPSDVFPAIKIENEVLTINENYYLFKNNKIFDVVLKTSEIIHRMYTQHIISEDALKYFFSELETTLNSYKT